MSSKSRRFIAPSSTNSSSTLRHTRWLTRSLAERESAVSLTAGSSSTKSRIRRSSRIAQLAHIVPIREKRGSYQGEHEHHEQVQSAVEHRPPAPRKVRP